MKIQLDTTNLIIKIEETVNLGEFMDMIDKLLPHEAWREFKLETHSTINWNQTPINFPIYQPFVNPPPYAPAPTYPWITYTAGSNNATAGDNIVFNNGTYDINCIYEK